MILDQNNLEEAVDQAHGWEGMEGRSEAAVDNDVELLTEALHARRRGDFATAEARFMEVYDRDRNNPWPLIEMAQVEFLRSDFRSVRQYLEQVEALAEIDEETWDALATAWLNCLSPLECLRVAQRAQELFAGDDRFFSHRLKALERLNRVEEAAGLIDGAGEIPPPDRISAAKILRRAGRLEEGLQLLAGNRSAGALVEKARILDRAGKSRLAVESLSEAKRQLAAHPETQYNRTLEPKIREQQARERGIASAEEILKWTAALKAEKPLPLAFLIGHPRSGTTLLESLIERLGGAAIASEFPILENEKIKWVQDLATRDTTISPLLKDEGLAALRGSYWQQLTHVAAAREGQLVIDKNPGLTDGVQWIAKYFPEAKILTALRDPRDVVVSCMFQDFGFSRLGVACLSWEGAAHTWADTMTHWVEMRGHLPDDRWLEVRYEDLVRDPDAIVGEVLTFLGLSRLEEPTAPDRLIRTPSYPDATSPVHTKAVQRWRAYERWLNPLRPIIEPVMKRLGYDW